jgi:DNA-binding response OmpR family regulator
MKSNRFNEIEMKILLLEDDFKLATEIKVFLKDKNFECEAVYDGNLFLKQFSSAVYDLFILDINVPGTNGLEVCSKVRSTDKSTPVIMLTAFSQIEEKVEAFRNGADDYLVKPFHFDELYIRINALMRRNQKPQLADEILQVEDLQINISEMKVCRGNSEINLTPKEYQLLLLLARAKGKPVSKPYISDMVWDLNFETGTNTIEVYINFLRKKIDKNFEVKLIHTRPGFE